MDAFRDMILEKHNGHNGSNGNGSKPKPVH
jgi:hypothetical protein